MSAEIIQRLDDILSEARRTNGRVSALEEWRREHSEWSAGIDRRLDDLTSNAVEQIEAAVGRVLDERETASKAAAYDALQERFGPDPEGKLGRWSATTRLLRDTAMRGWIAVITLAAGAGAGFVIERWF